MNGCLTWTIKGLNIWILKKEWTNLLNQKVILPYFMLFILCMFLHQNIIQHTQSVIHHLWHISAVHVLASRCLPQGFIAIKVYKPTWQSSFCSSSYEWIVIPLRKCLYTFVIMIPQAWHLSAKTCRSWYMSLMVYHRQHMLDDMLVLLYFGETCYWPFVMKNICWNQHLRQSCHDATVSSVVCMQPFILASSI